MRGSVIAVALVAGSVMAAGTARAQSQSNAPDAPHSRFGNPTSIARIYQTYIYGVVKKAEKSDLILDKTKFGNDQNFKLTKDTKFIQNGKRTSRVPLKPGDMVWIDMKRDKKSGDMIAKKVVLGVAPTGGPNQE